MNVRSAVLVLLAAPLASLGGGVSHASQLKTSIEQVRAYVAATCPYAEDGTKAAVPPRPAAAGIGAVLIPSLVSAGVDMVAAALTAAGANKDTAITASAQTNFYLSDGGAGLRLNPEFGCLVVVGNSFGEDAKENWPSETAIQAWDGPVPRFYFQAAIEEGVANGVFRLKPTLFRFADSASSSWFGNVFGSGNSVSIAISFSAPGAAQPFGSHIFLFPEQPLPMELKRSGLEYLWSAWMPVFPLANIASKEWEQEVAKSAAKKAVETKRLEKLPFRDTDEIANAFNQYCAQFGNPKKEAAATPGAAPKEASAGSKDGEAKKEKEVEPDPACTDKAKALARIADMRADAGRAHDEAHLGKVRDSIETRASILAPTNVTVLVTETRYGSRFAAALGAALTASKQGIVDEAKARLPSAQAAAEVTARNTQDDNDVAALNARAAVDKAQAVVDALDANASAATRAEKEALVRAAKIAANKAYRNAGRAEPYPGIVP